VFRGAPAAAVRTARRAAHGPRPGSGAVSAALPGDAGERARFGLLQRFSDTPHPSAQRAAAGGAGTCPAASPSAFLTCCRRRSRSATTWRTPTRSRPSKSPNKITQQSHSKAPQNHSPENAPGNRNNARKAHLAQRREERGGSLPVRELLAPRAPSAPRAPRARAARRRPRRHLGVIHSNFVSSFKD